MMKRLKSMLKRGQQGSADPDMEAGTSSIHGNNPESLTGTRDSACSGRSSDADKRAAGDEEAVPLLPISDNAGGNAASMPSAEATPAAVDAACAPSAQATPAAVDAACAPSAQATPAAVDAGDCIGDDSATEQNSATERNLHQLASAGEYTECEKILNKQLMTINAQDKKNQTALHIATISGHQNIVELLIRKGANKILKDGKEFIPLHYAAQKGHLTCCRSLLTDQHKEQVNARNKQDQTPFMLSVMGGHYDCCQILICSDINIYDKDMKTAMHYAASNGNDKILKFLLNNNKKADCSLGDKYGRTALHEALRLNRVTCVQLLAKEADLCLKDKEGKGVLHYAVQNKTADCLKCLLQIPKVKAVINEETLNIETQNKETQTDEMQTNKASKRTKKESKGTALYHAIQCHSYRCIDELLEAGASVTGSPNKLFPLHIAAKKGLLEVCQQIIKKDVSSLMKTNNNGETPLHMAAQSNNRMALKLIISYFKEHEISISLQDNNGQTPLHVAAKHKDAMIIQELVDVSGRILDKKRDTALHIAVLQGCLDSSKFLIKKSKAPLLMVNEEKHFPLDKAFERYTNLDSQNVENLKIVDFLLKSTSLNYLHETIEKNKEHAKKLKEKQIIENDDKVKIMKLSQLEDNVKLLKKRLTKHFKEALKKNQWEVLEAIIDSSWWVVPYSTGVEKDSSADRKKNPSEMKKEFLNFSTLVKTYPKLALQLLKKYTSEDQKNLMIYDFTLFENNYWLKEDEDESPFDKDGKLDSRAKERFPKTKYEYHPVTLMVSGMKNDLLQHQLTQAWLSYKWNSYIFWIHFAFIVMDAFHFVFLLVYMATVWNFKDISSCYEIWSKHQFEVPQRIYGLLYFSCIWILLQEIYFIYKLQELYFTPDTAGQIITRTCQWLCTMVLIISPLGMSPECRRNLGVVQEERAWQCGVVTVLLAWLCLINSINQTLMTEFLPVLKDILKIFLKVLFFVIMFVLIFAFIFHLLLKKQANFKTFPQAVGSSLSWMILDLDYGDIFVNSKLQYPIETNIIFFLFVTTVVSLVMSLISKQGGAGVEDKQYSLSFRRVSLRVGLIFRLDICFPRARQFFATNKWSKVKKDPTFLDKFLGNIEVTSPDKEEETQVHTSMCEEIDKMFQMLKTFKKLLEDTKEENAHKNVERQYNDIYALLTDIKNQTKKKQYGTF